MSFESMAGTRTIFDHAVFALLLVVPFVEWRWNWPRYLRRLATGISGVRLRYYRNVIAGEWLPAVVLMAVWAAWRRSWSGLWLGSPHPWRLVIGFVCAAAVSALLVAQQVAILKRPETHEKVRAALKYAEPLLPSTAAERRIFWLVAFTAGVCEEIFYRGFLTWYLTAWMGLVPAVLLSAVLFGFGHVYLGPVQVPKTALVGLVLSGVVLASASLWPAMLLHAALDWNSGELGFRMLGKRGDARPTH
jgi:uncharacterized protein